MDSTNQQVVTLRVFGSNIPTGGCSCGGGCCGSDDGGAELPSQEDQARDLETTLTRHYGASVRVEYVDVFSQAMAAFPQELKLISIRRLPLPLVTVNNEPLFAGGLPLNAITGVLKARGISPVTDAELKEIQ